jgi:hypothetical protein
LLFQPGWRVRLLRVRRSVARRDWKFFEDLANQGGFSGLPWPRKNLDKSARFPEPIVESLELKPFIHGFLPRKLILLNTLSIFTQFFEKIKSIWGHVTNSLKLGTCPQIFAIEGQ